MLQIKYPTKVCKISSIKKDAQLSKDYFIVNSNILLLNKTVYLNF